MLREEIRAEGMDARRALALGNALERAGKLLDAIEALTTANALHPDHGVERRLVRLRRRAFAELVRSRTPGPAVPVVAAGPPANGAPEPVPAGKLSAAHVREGIQRHGCLWVRGLVPPERAARLRSAIDHAFAAREAVLARRASADDRA